MEVDIFDEIQRLRQEGRKAALATIVLINRKLYLFFLRRHGMLFAAGSMALHFLYYLYSGLTYVLIATAAHWERMRRPVRRKAERSVS